MQKLPTLTTYSLCFLLFALVFFSCESPEEVFSTEGNIQLSFSTDTVYFDTLITEMQSTTFRFRAYNPSKNAINISNISLGKGAQSPYTVTINGVQSPSRDDIRVLGGDSLLILVSTSLEAQNMDLPYVVQDSVVFETNGNRQDIKLVAWGQDAHFLRDSILDCDVVWPADRPYVIYDAILVDSACSLTIEEGATIYMHNGANFYVRGSLETQGTPEKPVTFSSTRQDEPYDRTPGQWGTLLFLGSSGKNKLQGTHISNGLFGVYLEPSSSIPTEVTMNQCKIENMAFAGMWSFGGTVQMTNCLINNCLANTVACVAGGNYSFDHCTFANYGFDFFREEPSILLTNFAILESAAGETLLASDLNVTMRNSIIWGSLQEEVFYPEQLADFDSTVVLDNCIVKSTITDQFTGSSVLLTDPFFLSPQSQDFRLDTLSPAKDIATPIGITRDFLGVMRDSKPDIGAYERVE